MKINIEESLLVYDIQKEFNSSFPFLKIEFLSNKSNNLKLIGSTNNKFVNPETNITGLNKNIKPCSLIFSENTTVQEIENMFYNELKLVVCVLRKSGNLWIETSMTGNWTLNQQNEHGREISSPKAIS